MCLVYDMQLTYVNIKADNVVIMNNLPLNTTVTLHKENWRNHAIFNDFEISWLGRMTQVSTDVFQSGFDSKCKETNSILLISIQVLS